ncbi:hypothetical protein BBAD15_g9143 [Beauveria bassiana D1-5]|uniref:Uncharacterized protein n=1 Tax=Beauveria bassiana D1-5 TaxID=1245745 RepID=A0A0A2VDI4_BEABA|nr:hypothetical protein BBAD15_g9143 [Beauveria bassiana D1-5]
MKTAVGIVFTAALGSALPHADKSATTLSSRDTESKLPWIPYKGTYGPCMEAVHGDGGREAIEKGCGTEGFCDLLNPVYGPDNLERLSKKYGYANNTECYAAHDKIPWVEYKEDYGACMQAVHSHADREDFEEACGTEGFCDMFNPEYGTESLKRVLETWGQYGFKTHTECYAGHTKKPWVEWKDYGSCHDVAYSVVSREKYEAGCGTETFCDLFNPEYGTDSLKRMTERYGYATVADCIADHEPQP